MGLINAGIKIRNKKGIFFTMMAILIISLFVLSYTFYNEIKEDKSVNNRVNTMNNFLFSVEKDLERQMYIFGFRTIFLIEKKIVETGTYRTNINQTFHEAFFNGTIYGEAQALLNDAKFSHFNNTINNNAKKINVDIIFSDPKVEVTQDDPWHIKVTLIADLEMSDIGGVALWKKTEKISGRISVENFEDPIYYTITSGRASNKITRTPYTDFSVIADFSEHATNSYYKADSDAPSFLDRLAGNITIANPQGIESIVNLQKLSQQGVSVQEKSTIDHIYFSSDNPSFGCVNGMPSWFRIDDTHADKYNVTVGGCSGGLFE
ncbi:hypothetical protein HYV50_02995 [Candidatus Pacearchaeota archaeon]|nr:hypothetical protein [Candidatus Pacearchaeota archaeon]